MGFRFWVVVDHRNLFGKIGSLTSFQGNLDSSTGYDLAFLESTATVSFISQHLLGYFPLFVTLGERAKVIYIFSYLQESLDYCVMNDDHKEVEQYVRRNLPAGCVVDMDTLTRVTSKAILEKERPVEKVYWYSILRNKKLLFILFASCYMR